MDSEAEVIKEQMEDTRASLAQKLESLEEKVMGTLGTIQSTTDTVTHTFENVKEAVEGTVESVKESVEETFENVKEAFDVASHFRRYPWLMLGGSVAVGFAAGHLLHRLLPRERPRLSRGPFSGIPTMSGMTQPDGAARRDGGAQAYRPPAAEPPAPAAERREEKPSWIQGLNETFGSELHKLKGLAIGTALGVVRDMLKQAATPELGAQLAEVVNGITAKLGGEVIRGPLVEKSDRGPQAPHPRSQAYAPGAPGRS